MAEPTKVRSAQEIAVESTLKIIELENNLQRERESYLGLKHSLQKQLERAEQENQALRDKIIRKDITITGLEVALANLHKAVDNIICDNEDGTMNWAFTTTEHDVSQILRGPIEEAGKLLGKSH